MILENYNILFKLSLRMTVVALLTVMAVTVTARDVKQARQAAILQMKKHAAKKAINRSGETMAVTPQLVYSKAKRDNEQYYYVFSAGKNMGYTVVSGDDRLPAIVGYTENGDFDAKQLPETFVEFLNAYQDFVDNATESQINEVTALKTQVKHAPVEPLMKEKWNQGKPYNNMCPEYTTGKRSATGCVATAVAQILHYWKCPNELKADIPAYETQTKISISMPGISAGEQYDWQNIQNEYTGYETAVQNDAVAKLMLHTGCAVRMNYGPSSFANADAKTFVEYFGMDKKYTQQIYRTHYNSSMWDYVLYNEISAKRPVYYSGLTKGTGHAFVIHGYDDGLYYVNWGWGGYADGYFDITILDSSNPGHADASSSKGGFNLGNDMIIGIQPDSGDKDDALCPVFISHGFYVNSLKFENGNVRGSAEIYVANYFSDVSRYVSVGYVDDENVIHKIADSHLVNSKPTPNGGAYPGSADCKIEFSAENGRDYPLYVIESNDQHQWSISGIRYEPIEIRVHDDSAEAVTLKYSLSAEATLNKESDGYAGKVNKINVTVNNSGEKEYRLNVWVKVSDTPELPENFFKGLWNNIPAQGSVTDSFEFTPQTAGTYNFWIEDIRHNVIGMSTITFNAIPDAIIDTMKDAENTSVIYNLYGEKVVTPNKGIYIKNGKKYVIK